jgi:hypothetical protein
MKKFAALFMSVFFGLSVFGQSTLNNGNFEGWYFAPHPTHAGQGFYEPTGGFFQTLNILDTIATPPGLTAYPTDSMHTGAKAARVITRKINALDVVIPGVIGTIAINWTSLNATLGKPFIWSTKPTRFQGYYMSFPLNGDSSAAIILLSKWNAGTHKRDTIAYNRLVVRGKVTSYTQFDEAIQYRDAVTVPDSITVLLLSCAGYNAAFMMASVGQVGSQAYFDDVTLTNISGMEYLLMPEVNVKLSPNPARDYLQVELSEVVKNGVFEIYTIQGKMVGKHPLQGRSQRMNLEGLPNGVYFFKVTDGGRAVNTGEFIVSN